MAGFVAIIANRPEGRVSPEELSDLVGSYRALRPAQDVQVLQAGERVRAACISNELPVTISRDGESWLATVGTLYASGDPVRSAPSDLDGQFAAVRHIAETGTVQVLTDCFGMQSVYSADRGDRTYIATSLIALARHLQAAPDPVGLKMFLRTGAQYGPRTHWDGIERLPAATVVEVGSGPPARSAYWRPTVDPSIRAMNLHQTIDHCVELGLDVIGRRLQDSTLISADLTGGFDSRMVTAFMARLGVPFETMTVKEELVDARLARAVALAGGWKFEEQALPSDWHLTDEALLHALAWGDATLEVFNLSQVLWRQQDRTRVSRDVVTGGGGENFGSGPYMQELWRAGRTKQVNFENLMNMRLFLPLDVSIFRSDPRIDAEAYVRDILHARLLPYADEPNTTKLDVIHAFREPGHFGIYRSAGEAHVRAQLPCYFKTFWSAGFSANYKWRNGHQIHRGVTQRLNPAVAAVETQRGGPAELLSAKNAIRFVPYYSRLARTAVRKVRRRSTTLSQRPTTGYDAYREALRRLRSEGRLDPATMRSAALFDGHALNAFFSAAERGDAVNWALMGRVVTVELMLQAAANDRAVVDASAAAPA